MSSDGGPRPLEFRLLGTFEVTAGGRVLEIGSAKQRAMLAMLALRLNRVVSVGTLVEELWGDSPPADATASVRILVSRLRRGVCSPGAGACLRAREPGYVLEADPACLDAQRFEELAARGRRALAGGDPEGSARALEEALSLWRGPALADVAERPFARLAAARLEEARLGAVEELAEAELALGRPAPALARLEAHVAEHPLRERAWGQLMVALYRLGRQADALRAYQQVRRALGEELGIELTPALRRLEEQILLQRPELEGLLSDHLPPDISLLPLGEQHLADLSRPERVFQVGHPDLPSGFPPLRSTGRRRHNLPVSLTAFVGRARELDDVSALLGSSRLVTLTGVGGAGKTRLALEVAGGLLDHFPDGTWLVELGPLRDPGAVASAMTVALGLVPSGLAPTPEALTDRLCEHLQSRRALLVLDNCEHLVEAAARLAHTVLSHCPEVRVLATSREILGVPGEVAWAVPPLALPANSAGLPDLAASDSVALFCERARAAQPGFGLSADNAVAVVEICRRLDGIPLALELAAARMRALGAWELAQRLDRRLSLLSAGGRTAVARHRTLRAALDWSYELLSAAEQTFFSRLSVFPASFDLKAAQTVAGEGLAADNDDGLVAAGNEAVELCSRLVDKSLVLPQAGASGARYRLLETLREHASEKLAESGGTEAARRRHRDFFLEVTEVWRRTDERTYWDSETWAREVDDDDENFRAAVDWSLAVGESEAAVGLVSALWLYWLFGGRPEGPMLLEAALALPPPVPSPARVNALCGLGYVLRGSGRVGAPRPEALFEEALRMASEDENAFGVSEAHYHLGELATLRGDLREAASHYRGSLRAWEGTESAGGGWSGWCHYGLGWVAATAGEEGQGRAHFERALRFSDGRGPVGGEMLRLHALAALAIVVAATGEAERAEMLANEALVMARRMPAPLMLAMALTRAAGAAIVSRRTERAELVLRELLGLLRDLGARSWVAEALETAALVHEARDRPKAAARLLGAAGSVRDDLGEPARSLALLSERLEACRARLAETLGAGALAEGEALGQGLSVPEAISRALGELDEPAPRPR